MIPTVETEAFRTWLSGLRDRQAVARINTRIMRLRLGNPGDVASVGDGVSELRLMFGPGYRVYFATRGQELILLLAGGDKGTQANDIKAAKKLWTAWKEENDG
ncbi:MAG: type II toxin-antitoxin system RelE/ParE family toxin [Hyphomonadaceae bacterium]|nr:type II toxin-antitoxin system RelE/ParE family toxin [Hyphomonadaceae bacterium]